MATPAPIVRYRKLPGRSSGLTGYTTLYQGPDHLLQVHATGYSETYKRFYFRDVQAFLVVRTGYWTLGHVLAATVALGALGLSLIILLTGEPDWRLTGYVMGGAGAALAVVLGLSLLGGPACRCAIRTAVQTERLPSLSRLRRARRVVERLRPAIEEAQARGDATPATPTPAADQADASPLAGEDAAPPPGLASHEARSPASGSAGGSPGPS